MTLTFPLFAISTPGQIARALFPRSTAPKTQANTDYDPDRKDREFFLEMMARNPDTLQSDLGCMAMMSQYRQHF